MSFSDLFESGSRLRNLTHFSSLVKLAAVDGAINTDEEIVLKKLADKLDIEEPDYKKVVAHPNDFPISVPNTNIERLERLYDVLTLIFADCKMTQEEERLLKRYAVALGFSSDDSQTVIDRSIKILGGKLSFEDYLYLLRRPKN